MKALRRVFPVLLLTLSQAFAGTPAEAALIRKEFTLASETWELKLKVAASEEAQRELWKQQPNLNDYAHRLWGCLRPSLMEDWTIEPAAWLVRVSPAVVETKPDGSSTTGMKDAVDLIRKSIEEKHLLSPKLAPMCLALANDPDPRALSLLEKIESKNPEPKVQGVAALSLAIKLKGFEEDVQVMKKRLTLLRKAIINSASEEIEGVTVASLAEDELYLIRYLTKGRVAPDLMGVDTGNRPMKLSDYKDKVVVLLFWANNMPESERTLAFCSSLEQKFAGQPFALVGVNADPVSTLRSMQSRDSDRITWPNFSDPGGLVAKEFRIGTRPFVYVLDRDRKIRYSGAPGSFVELTADAILSEKKAPATEPKPPAASK